MRPKPRRFVVAFVAALVAITTVGPVSAAWPSVPAIPVHGIDPRNMDLSVDPAEDFYRFANGGWLDRTEIPANEGGYSAGLEVILQTEAQLLDLLNDLAAGADLQEGSDEWKAVELFAQGTDLDARDDHGVAPIQPILDGIDAIGSLEEFHEFQQGARFAFLTSIFFTYVGPGLDDSSVNVAYLSGPYFGLPNRDYYLEEDAGNDAVREAYVAASAEFLTYAGYDDQAAAAAAEAVYALERDLVEPTLTREEQQDISLFNNPMTLAELEATYPLMDWEGYLEELGLTNIEYLVVDEKRYLEALDGIVTGTELATLKDWVKLEALWRFAYYLSAEIEQTAFDFHSGVLAGIPEPLPLDVRVLNHLNFMVGDAVGQLYVAEYFPPEAKEQIEALIESLIVAFRQRIETNAWMSEETKAIAIEKLDKLAVKVGYPDKWRSYDAVEVEDSYAMSVLSALNAEYRRSLAKAGQPVDPTEWFVPPQVVNAFYDPFNNEIVFPAAILQAPFFDYRADPAVNFGAIGTVIGHEITHGFDLQGSQFDAEGDLANWWDEEDAAAFQELNDAAAAQYAAIEVLPELFIDGQITVTENVADMGGIQVAYDGLQTYLEENGDPGKIDGFTQEQRFFIAAATVWREEIRDELLTTVVKTDVHSPGSVRATQPMRNMDEYYEAFDIGPGDPMYLPPDERIVIW